MASHIHIRTQKQHKINILSDTTHTHTHTSLCPFDAQFSSFVPYIRRPLLLSYFFASYFLFLILTSVYPTPFLLFILILILILIPIHIFRLICGRVVLSLFLPLSVLPWPDLTWPWLTVTKKNSQSPAHHSLTPFSVPSSHDLTHQSLLFFLHSHPSHHFLFFDLHFPFVH